MIQKEECISGVVVKVNKKKSAWNESFGTKHNGLFCFPFQGGGGVVGFGEKEVLPGTKLNILSEPKQYGETGVEVKFFIDGDNTIYSTYWVSFKHKVDKVNP